MQNNLNAGSASPDINGTSGLMTLPGSGVPYVIEDAETKRKRKLLRQHVACDLLLARLFQNHPTQAMAALKGVKPNVVDLEPPPPPETSKAAEVVPLPVGSVDELIGRQPTIREILEAVCRFYNVRPIDVCAHRRHKSIDIPRKIAIYLARHLTLCPLSMIGKSIGDRDHTSCLTAANSMEQIILVNPRVADEVEVIKLHIADRILNRAVQ